MTTWDLIDAEVREYSSRSGEDRAHDLFLQAIAAAEARGYSRAMEQAARVCDHAQAVAEKQSAVFGVGQAAWWTIALEQKETAARIRAMKDEGGE